MHAMKTNPRSRPWRRGQPVRRQRGVTMLVVMILLMVMLLGGLSLARMTEVGTLVAGNVSYKERAIQAAEVGLNDAYAAIQAFTAVQEASNQGSWYYAEALAQTTDGLPSNINWDNARVVTVGAADEFSVNYVVERLCTNVATTPYIDQACLLRKQKVLSSMSEPESVEAPMAKQYRITVRVTGPKGARTFVQSLVTRG